MPAFTTDPIDLGDDRDPWEQQPRESAKRFGQFCAFRDQGSARTLTTTAKTLTVSYGYVRDISAHFRWVERAQAYDRDQDRKLVAKTAEDRHRAAQVHLRLGNAIFTKVTQRLAGLQPESIKPMELARLAEVALKLQQAGLGLPESTVAVVGDPAQPVAHEDITGLTREQRRVRLDEVLAEVARRRGQPLPERDEAEEQDESEDEAEL